MIERSSQLEPLIVRLETARSRLERDIALLNDRDPDLIAELAVERLGFAFPADRVVIFPDKTAATAERFATAAVRQPGGAR